MIAEQPGAPSLIYIDLHLCHEVTTPQAFQTLRERGLKVRRPDLTIATMDHSTPTTPHNLPILDLVGKAQLDPDGKRIAPIFGIRLYNLTSDKQGIVHVMGPEQGLPRPGMTIVCASDSYTATPREPLVHLPSASAPARWDMYWPASACCSSRPKVMRSVWRENSSRASPPRILSSPSSPGSASAAGPNASSNTTDSTIRGLSMGRAHDHLQYVH